MTLTEGQQTILRSKIWQEVFNALVVPTKVISRLALYETSEAKSRHLDAGMSILRYALAGYVTGVLNEIEGVVDPIVDPYGDEVDISEEGSETITVEYPVWLSEFFEDDAHFAYLQEDNTIGLAEILFELQAATDAQAISFLAPPEVDEGTDDAETEAPQGDDPGDESSGDEDHAEADDNPNDDLSRY